MIKNDIINKVNNKTLAKLNRKILKEIITTPNNKYIVIFHNKNRMNFCSLSGIYSYFKNAYKLEKNIILNNNNNNNNNKKLFKPYAKEILTTEKIYLKLLENIKKILTDTLFSDKSEYIKELNIEEEIYKNKNLILKVNKTILNEKIRRLYEKELHGKGDLNKYIKIINNLIETI